MSPLELSLLNLRSPYVVWEDAQGLHFRTDYDVVYMVEFCSYDVGLRSPAYWFNLYNLSGKNSPNDTKLQQTIVCIVEEFFRVNPDILLYICDTANNRQAMRAVCFTVGLKIIRRRISILSGLLLWWMKVYLIILRS